MTVLMVPLTIVLMVPLTIALMVPLRGLLILDLRVNLYCGGMFKDPRLWQGVFIFCSSILSLVSLPDRGVVNGICRADQESG